MATAAASSRTLKEFVFEWEGKDRNGKAVRGEIRAAGENQVQAVAAPPGRSAPRRSRSAACAGGKSIKPKDIAIFTRQLATMMKAGVPLLQAFDIVGRGNANPSVTKLLNDIRSDVETGTSLSAAFRKFPMYFDNLYCNLVEAGEAAGILEESARPACHLHGEDRGDQVEDQVGADVPDLGGRRRLRGGRDHHDLRDPGLQAGVHLLRRRPAGAHADRHGDQRVLRRLLVADLRRGRRRHLLLPPGLEAQRARATVHGPGAAARCRSSAR